ncbi:hypothetical protein CJF31_00007267 [Rutstroemia sp. NJR-2017a BVV2]|nr:hypothetical protein CJF31_00007267 [Rutstroemia sp. NJR-2017a BVV2]
MLRLYIFIFLLAIVSSCVAYVPQVPSQPRIPRSPEPEYVARRDALATTTILTATTTTISSTIPTKTIAGCNIQGTAAPDLAKYYFSSMTLVNSTTCQLYCVAITQCVSYSWQPSMDACSFYHQWINGLVEENNDSGIYYSDKYPSDGTNFCYGDHQL